MREYSSSVFEEWHDKAAIVSGPIAELPRSEEGGGEEVGYFSPRACPVLEHPKVVVSGKADRLSAILLAQHLSFTVTLELDYVCRWLRSLIDLVDILGLSPKAKSDAFLVFCDEVYHSKFSSDLLSQLKDRVCLPEWSYERDRRFLEFDRTERGFVDEEFGFIAPLIMAYVSESLITETLASMHRDSKLAKQVGVVLALHSDDEWRHRRFFEYIAHGALKDLEAEQRAKVGKHMNRFAAEYLQPDYGFLDRSLALCGFEQPEISEILQTSYAPDFLAAHWAGAIRLMKGLSAKYAEIDFQRAPLNGFDGERSNG